MDKKKQVVPPFDTTLLSGFQFGDPDGKLDDVLLHSAIMVRGVREFLSGNKAIVLGERGAGKSALFKLLSEGTFKFAESVDRQLKPLVIAIDSEIQYLAVANVVEERFEDKAKKANGKYAFLWEIFILGTLVQQLSAAYPGDTEAQTLEQDLAEVLGVKVDKKFGIADFFARFRYSVGTKFDQNGAVTPNFAVEPVKTSADKARYVTDHEVAQFRDRVRKFIKAKRRVVYVLVDRIDDFVTDQEYEEQKKNVQALVDCIQNYRYPELKLKIFLRADIFGKLNFERGVDKVAHQVVRLEWTTDDICEFVARRLYYNFQRLNIKLPHIGMNLQLLDVDPSVREQAFEIVKTKPRSVGEAFKLLGQLVVLIGKMKITHMRRKGYTARKTNSLDAVYQKLITFIFPTRIAHMSPQCKREELPIKNFLGAHFGLGGQGPNPRLVLLFVQSVFEEAAEYYRRNPDKKLIAANVAGEYELLLNEHALVGYQRTQRIARQTLAGLNASWAGKVEKLFATLKRPNQCGGLSLDDLKQATDWTEEDEDFHRFIAFFNHVGLFEDESRGSGTQYGERTYRLPTVVRMCV